MLSVVHMLLATICDITAASWQDRFAVGDWKEVLGSISESHTVVPICYLGTKEETAAFVKNYYYQVLREV